MTPRQFLDGFQTDRRLSTGGYYGKAPFGANKGDTVGVVLLTGGAPAGAEEVPEYLYRLLMDPAAVDVPLPTWLRDRVSRVVAGRRARGVGRAFQQIGGGTCMGRHTREQGRAVERRLNERLGDGAGIRFRAYVAARYGCPSSEAAAAEMLADGVNRVVLLPLHPQYSRSTTGASVAYWHALEQAGEIASLPTTMIHEYATHPKYIEALSERIDEALQRFPRDVRDRAHLVFSAHGASETELQRRGDAYCCLVHATVAAVVAHRAAGDAGRRYHVAFGRRAASWPAQPVPTAFDLAAEEGAGAIVVVPVASVSDHLETTFELDIRIREAVLHAGIEHFEVTAGLNCHPLFIEALAECVEAQVGAAGAPELAAGTGANGRHEGRIRCPVCSRFAAPRTWPAVAAVASGPAPPAPSLPARAA